MWRGKHTWVDVHMHVAKYRYTWVGVHMHVAESRHT